MRKLSDAQQLYKAVMKSPIGHDLRRLPTKVRGSFHVQLEGLQIPGEGFQAALATLVENQLRCFSSPEDFMDKFEGLKRLASLCGKSSKPGEFMEFLAMSRRIERFIESMVFFANGRDIKFEPVPEDIHEEAGHIMALVEGGSDEAIRTLASIMRERLSGDDAFYNLFKWENDLVFDAYLVVARIFDEPNRVMEIFWKDHPDSSVHKMDDEEIMHYGDFIAKSAVNNTPGLLYENGKLYHIAKTFNEGRIMAHLVANPKDLRNCFATPATPATSLCHMVVSSESEVEVEHELQHLFDHLIGVGMKARVEDEERAFLATLAFMQEESTHLDIRCMLSFADTHREDIDGFHEDHRGHLEALCRVNDMMDDSLRSFETAKAKAMELLSEEYRRLIGLTYDEILEPFRK